MAEEKLVQTQDNVEAVNETPVKTRVSTENNKLSFKQKMVYDLKNMFYYKPANITMILLLVPGVLLGLFMGQHITSMNILPTGYEAISFYLFVLILLGCISIFGGVSFTAKPNMFHGVFNVVISVLIAVMGFVYIYQYIDYQLDPGHSSRYSITNSDVMVSVICVGISVVSSLVGSIFGMFHIDRTIEKDS